MYIKQICPYELGLEVQLSASETDCRLFLCDSCTGIFSTEPKDVYYKVTAHGQHTCTKCCNDFDPAAYDQIKNMLKKFEKNKLEAVSECDGWFTWSY